jgi:predicted metalloprotease with PDZ domain
MLKYKLYVKNPASRYLYIDLVISGLSSATTEVNLPAWRPGRYELGNFSKNIKKFEAFNKQGNPLAFRKTSKDTWVVQTAGLTELRISYSYYAADLNAGSTYVDNRQLYANPCNCLMYVTGLTETAHEVTLDIPDSYIIAASLPVAGKTLYAKNYDELADSPFFASASIHTFRFNHRNVDFSLHFLGECNPAQDLLTRDFKKFIEEQIAFFGGAHFSEYHFLFQILPVKFHHGVEHTYNTVIAFGPGYNLMHAEAYNEFLGLCCHEFFHTWNIKTIRPAEMFPYNYGRENYARTGFVYEGVTTYYGDKLLFTSGVFDEGAYFKAFEERLTKHLHNFGRFNLSVGDSSFDNWLDGYTPGAPYRKTNIYDEGCLVAFMLDVLILQHSKHRHSLQKVLKDLYEEYYGKKRGYTEEDYTQLCSAAAGAELGDFFKKYVYGLEPYEPLLKECFGWLGLHLEKHHAHTFYERYLGFKAIEHAHHKKVTMITPYSPAWKAGLSIHDEIVAVNGFTLKNDLNQWLTYFAGRHGRCTLTVLSGQHLHELEMSLALEGDFFYTYKIMHAEKAGEDQKKNFARWKQAFA